MNLRNFIIHILVVSVLMCFSAPAIAEDDPATVLKIASETNSAWIETIPLEQRFQAYLDKMGWTNRVHEGGIIRIPEREIFVSMAFEFTKVNIGQPGWIESRLIAFERAELEAKTKIVRFLAESIETERSIDLLEKASWSDGSIEEAKNLGEVEKTLTRIKNKTLALSESVLDNAMEKLDPDYDPDKYDTENLEQLKTIVEDKFHQQIKSMALKTLIGVTPLYSTEGKIGNEYQVLVSVIWSPKLNRLAMSLMNDEYNIPAVRPGKTLEGYIPKEEMKLIGAIGTRVVIDENGHFAIMAYAQAQPRKASPNRIQSSLLDAKQISANRARGMIVNYIKEGLVLRDEASSREISREFSDMSIGTENLRNFQHTIHGKKVTMKLRGLSILKEWSLQHPETGQNVAGAVMAWSPSLASISGDMDAAMKTRPKLPNHTQNKSNSEGNTSIVIESMEIDTSAY